LGASHSDTGRIGCSGFYWLNQFRRESRWIFWPVDRRHPFVERILLFARDLFFVCRFRFGCNTDFSHPDSRQRFKTQPVRFRGMMKMRSWHDGPDTPCHVRLPQWVRNGEKNESNFRAASSWVDRVDPGELIAYSKSICGLERQTFRHCHCLDQPLSGAASAEDKSGTAHQT